MAEPKRTMGVAAATALVVGSVIGSGIFLTPAIVAGHVPAAGLILLVWLAGGALSLVAALSLAELGAMFPRAGGQFVFLKEAFGNGTAFLFGWMALAINYSGTIAAIAVACAFYLGVLIGWGTIATKVVAIGLIWILTAVNIAGLRPASGVQLVSTVGKLAALGALVLVGLAIGGEPAASLLTLDAGDRAAGTIAASFGLALVAALFAFDGMASATFVGGEVKDPRRTIVRATVAGALIVTVVYLAVNLAFLKVLPVERLAENDAAAFDVGTALGGGGGGDLIAAAVVIATFGTLNGYVLQSPRIYYAMARDRLLYRGFARLHPRWGTPVFGLILQAEWSSLLVLSGTYDQLITYVVMSSWLFLGLTGVALFRLRFTRPDLERPFSVPGYPFVPALFIAGALLVVGNSLVFDPWDSLIGVGLALSGVPIYFFVRAWRGGPSSGGEGPNTDS